MEKLLARIADFVPTVHGWCTVEKAQWLARWIVERQCTRIVEVGVFGGRSLVPMAMAMDYIQRLGIVQDCKLDGIDAYSNEAAEARDVDGPNKDWWKSVNLEVIQQMAKDAVIRHKVGHIVDFLVCTSVQAVVKIDDLSLDLVHVDGSHNQEESTRDVEIWWPKLRSGGVMVMDDTNWPSVASARALAARLGALVHHNEAWEAYQKVPQPVLQPGSFPG